MYVKNHEFNSNYEFNTNKIEAKWGKMTTDVEWNTSLDIFCAKNMEENKN